MRYYNWIEQKAVDMVYSIFTSPHYGKTIEAKCQKIHKVKDGNEYKTVISEERPIYKKINGKMNKMFINGFIENYGRERKYKIYQYGNGIIITGLSSNRPQYIINFIDKSIYTL